MDKLILPTILVATVLVAGFAALVPIDDTQAVHTTIQNSQLNAIDVTVTADFSTEVDGQCANNFLLYFVVNSDSDNDTMTIDTDDDATAEIIGQFITLAANEGTKAGVVGGVGGTDVEFDSLLGTPDGVFTLLCQAQDTPTFANTLAD